MYMFIVTYKSIENVVKAVFGDIDSKMNSLQVYLSKGITKSQAPGLRKSE